MYLCTASSDSKDIYPLNSPQKYTSELSQIISTKHHVIGLVKISFEVTKDIKNESVFDSMAYVMVNECADSEVSGHSHSVIRMISLKEFTNRSRAILRFANVLYVPIEKQAINTITVHIRTVDGCCDWDSTQDLELTGITRCTFHIKQC